MKQNILVTGASGYIGYHLLGRLKQSPNSVLYGLSRNPSPALSAEYQTHDDLLTMDLSAYLQDLQPDIIFHAVGLSPRSPFEQQLQVHAEGTRRLLQALVDNGQRPKVIVVGSAAEYGLQDEAVEEEFNCSPDGEYGVAKLFQSQLAQLFAKRHNLPVMIARVFNVYGRTERHLVIAAMAHQIARAEALQPDIPEISVHNLRSWRDFVHIDDVTEALIKLSQLQSQNQLCGQIYNIASGHSTPIGTVLDMLLDHTRLDADELKRLHLNVQGVQKEDISWASIHKIRQHTGWEPQIPLKDGLQRELNYWRAHLKSSTAIF